MNQLVEAEVIPAESFAIIQATETAKIDIQVATAHKYPRVLSQVKEQILEMATVDQETAEECFYALPRAGKTIEGPGVRLAEIVMNCYGNIRTNTYVVEVGKEEVTVRGECWDIQKNVGHTSETKRRITTKEGRRYTQDMIITTQNAAMSIALREAIFTVVPMAMFKKEIVQIKRVSLGADRPIEVIREQCVEVYKELGVSEEKLLLYVEKRKISDLTLDDISKLKGIYTGVKEGTISIDDLLSYREEKKGPMTAGTHTITPEKEEPKDSDEVDNAEAKKEAEKKKKKAAAAKKKADKAQKEADEAARDAEKELAEANGETEGPVNLENLDLD